MAKLKDLKVTIGLSKKGLTKLNADLRRTKGNFKRNFGEIASMAKNAAAAIGVTLVAAIGSVIKAGADMERLETGFRSITGGAEQAGKMVARLNQFAVTTPFQLENISRAARQLLAVGTTEDQLSNRLRMLGDIAASSGNQIEEIAAIFAKVKAKGKVELENLNQLAERGVPIFDELRKVTGDANMEFGAGAVSVSEFNQALEGMTIKGGFAEGAMVNLSDTITGKVTTAIDTLKVGLADLGEESGLLDVVSAAITMFTLKLKQSFGLTGDMTKVVADDVTKLMTRTNEVTTATFKDTQQALSDYRKELLVMRLGTRENSEDHAFLTEKIGMLDAALQTLNFSLRHNKETGQDVAVAIDEQSESTSKKIKVDRKHLEVLADVDAMQRNLAEDILASAQASHHLHETMKVGTPAVRGFSNAFQHVSNTVQNATRALFDNMKDASRGFHLYFKQVMEDLLIRVAGLVAAFVLLSIIMGGATGVAELTGGKAGLQHFVGKGLGLGVPQMADGGMFTGASLAMVGEGPGTSSINPEVVAPLDKLRDMMGGGNVTVTGRLDGRDILISSERAGFDRNRVRGF